MAHPESPQRKNRSKVRFRPNFTLSILYLIGFFALFSFLFLMPPLIEFADSLPSGISEDEAVAMRNEFASKKLGPLLGWMLVAATTVTGLGIYAGILPGTKRKA